MSWRRRVVYLILIAPLHYVLSIIAGIPAMLFLPPDIIGQLVLSLPLFVVAVWVAIPAFQRKMGLNIPAQRETRHRVSTVLGALVPFGVSVSAIYSGFATPVEGLLIGALALILFHGWLIRVQ